MKNPIPTYESTREILSWKMDIAGSPRKKFMEVMAQYASAEDEKKRLLDMACGSEAGKEEYVELFETRKINTVELLECFPSVELPLEAFLEVGSLLQPRYFTIASSNLYSPTSIHITVTVVQDDLPGDRIHKGVCSSYLSQLKPDKDVVHCFLRASSFVLPKTLATPIIMIGPGTGIAPMRAFLQEARYCQSLKMETKNWVLYFGCRYKDVDFLYEEELNAAVKDRIIAKLEVAFSRDQAKKVYVQHVLKEHGPAVWDTVTSDNGYVYICG